MKLKKIRVLILSFLLVLLQYVELVSQTISERNIQTVQAVLDDLVEIAFVPGVSAAIWHGGKVVWQGQSGYSDLENKLPVTDQTQFRAASVSKVITITALLKLLDEGKLNLDSEVRTYLPNFPKKQWPFTSRNLATHTSGIENNAANFEDKFYESVEDALDVFIEFPLLFEPDTEFLYSTHGFVLLSAVIEAAAKMPFLDFLQLEVFEPLSMTSTVAHNIHRPSKKTTRFYTRSGTTLELIEELEDPSYMWGGGGLLSTPTDLVKLGSAYFSNFFKETTVNEAFEPYRMKTGDRPGVGLGWRLSEDFLGNRVVEHNGIMQGTRAMLSLYPDEQIAVAFMANRRWGTFGSRTAHLIKHIMFSSGTNSTSELDVDYHGLFRGEQVEGHIMINNNRGSLSAPDVFKDWAGMPHLESLPIYHLKNELWVLVTPFGLLDLLIKKDGEHFTGQVIFNTTEWQFKTSH